MAGPPRTGRGVTTIDWRLGDSSELAELGIAGAGLAVFGASFHWTDRQAVVRTLDALLAPGAALVVVGDGLGDHEQPEWVTAIDEVRAYFLGSRRRAGSGYFPESDRTHAEVLRESPFSDVDAVSLSWHRRLTVDEVVGLQFTYSFSTPAMLGSRAGLFADAVREAVLALHADGVVTEPFRADVLIARRGG